MNHTLASLKKIIIRDIDLLEQEITLYPSEESLWLLKGEIKNTAGNLALHLCGNLRHFIGAILGNSGYVRNRDAEFSDKNIPKAELLEKIKATREEIGAALEKLDPALLQKEYPVKVFAEPMTTEYFLIHLAAHLTYHRGQINYHRRILTM